MLGPGIVTALFVGGVGAAVALAACSSSSSNSGIGGPDSSTGSDSPAGEAGACTGTGGLEIHYAPMYSAFITDSTMQQFQVPAIVTGGKGTASWSASPAGAVTFTPDPTTGGTIMTLKTAGPTVTVTAQIGSDCATAQLTVTSAVEADWAAGNARYNNGVGLYAGCIDQNLLPVLADAGIMIHIPPDIPDSGCPDAGPACTQCHGANATGGFFQGVLHTPEQTAGFSDQDLINIFTTGTVPDGGAFNPNIIPYNFWQAFHTWSDISTPEQQKGMVVYLRSLTPAEEEGGLNFGMVEEAGITGD
jgi:hypothetical protein